MSCCHQNHGFAGFQPEAKQKPCLIGIIRMSKGLPKHYLIWLHHPSAEGGRGSHNLASVTTGQHGNGYGLYNHHFFGQRQSLLFHHFCLDVAVLGLGISH